MTIIVKEDEDKTVYIESLEKELRVMIGYKEKNNYINKAFDFDCRYGNDKPNGYMAVIDEDYSLIKYLCEVFFMNDIKINHYGYPVVKRKTGELTTLSKAVLEYYSRFEDETGEMYLALNLYKYDYENATPRPLGDIQINHKNRNILDNRIENLEVVTQLGNIRHRDDKPYDPIISTEEIQELQEKSMSNPNYEKDKKFLQKISKEFEKCMKRGEINEKIVKNGYLELKYSKRNGNGNCGNSWYTSERDKYRIYKMMTKKDKNYIKKLIVKHNKILLETVIDNNIKLLERFQKRYKYLNKVLTKFKLNDLTSPRHLSIWESYKSRRILLDFFDTIKDFKKYCIEDGNILCTLDIRAFVDARGKYKAFLVAYLLGLLIRQNPRKEKRLYTGKFVHTPSFIRIPIYTERLLKKANKMAKKLLDLNLNKITYFTVSQAFGTETADKIFKNETLKLSYDYDIKAKEDMLEFLKNGKIIYKKGYLTVEDVWHHFKDLNLIREIEHLPHNKIYRKFSTFISSLLNYNDFIKNYMEEIRFSIYHFK